MKRILRYNSLLVSFFILVAAVMALVVFAAKSTPSNDYLSRTKIVNNTKGRSFLGLVDQRKPKHKLNPTFAQLDGDLPVTQIIGTLSSDQTWNSNTVYMASGVIVPSGVTLTINAGAIVKATNSYSNGITVEAGGAVHVLGSSSDPVIFTSYKDDTVGGDSNNDGPSINSYSDYGTAIRTNNGALDVAHAIFRGANQSVSAVCSSSPASVSVQDSVLNSQFYASSCGANIVSLQRNELDVQGGATAIYLASSDPSGVLLAGADQNIATGSDAGKAVYLNSNTVNTGKTWDISGTSGVIVMTGGLNVDGTMNVGSGVIIKTTNSYSNGIAVSQGGALNVTGTTSDPVIFTSYKDDNAGGDSNNDGASLGGYYDYSTAVRADNGTINVAHATFRAGSQGVYANCSTGANTITITDSILNSQTAFYNCSQGVVTMLRNQFAVQGGSMAVQASYTDVAGIALSGTDQNTGTGSNAGIAVFAYGATVASGETWNVSGTSGVVVQVGGVTVNGAMNVGAGAIIKTTNSYSNGIEVTESGSLNVTATASSPAIFTSYKDDSVGGDTNNDGPSAGGYTDYSTAVHTTNGLISVAHATFRSASNGFYASCSTGAKHITIDDSLLKSNASFYNCGPGVVTMQRNQLATQGGYASIYANYTDMAGIELAGANQNVATGSNAGRAVQAYNGIIAAGEAWNISGTSGAVVMASNVVVDGTVNIGAGATIKTTNGFSQGFSVSQNGVFNTAGTPASPVIFTSYKDDTAGGDSNNDGPSVGGYTDYSTAVRTDSGTLNIAHTTFRSGSQSIYASCSSSAHTISVTDSLFKSQVYTFTCGPGILSLQRNQFAVQGGYSAISANYTDLTGIALSGTNQNIGAGSNAGVVLYAYNSSVASGETWNVSGTSGMVVMLSNLTIDGTLHADPGAIFKIQNSGAYGITLNQNATLDVAGSSSSPVIFTSYKDDTIGGNSNNDVSTAAKGDYSTAITANQGATAQLSNAKIMYASTASYSQGATVTTNNTDVSYAGTGFYVPSGQATLTNTNIAHSDTGIYANYSGTVAFRGSMSDIGNKAVVACNWNSGTSCGVDASYTDWGSANGPGNLVCGQVETIPYKYNSTTYNGSSAFVGNCDGSTPPDQNMDQSITHFSQRVSSRQIDCSGGYQDACDAIHNAFACLSGAVNLAGSTSPIPLPQIHEDGSVDSWGSTVKSGAADYLRNSAIEAVLPSQMSQMFDKMMGLVGLFNSMSSAYNSCAP